VDAAYNALKHTPDLLPVLKDAGVVDSGGQGWTFIIEGCSSRFAGKVAVVAVGHIRRLIARTAWQEALVPEDEEGDGYDVQFLMRGKSKDVRGRADGD
jgi:dihydroxyacetone kinase-like predicted kinase